MLLQPMISSPLAIKAEKKTIPGVRRVRLASVVIYAAPMQDLRSGTFADTEGIARTFKLNDAHVRRILRFAYLAPDIVEAIAEGRQPRTLTVKRLLKGIPNAWQGQRALFGFTK